PESGFLGDPRRHRLRIQQPLAIPCQSGYLESIRSYDLFPDQREGSFSDSEGARIGADVSGGQVQQRHLIREVGATPAEKSERQRTLAGAPISAQQRRAATPGDDG